MGATAERMSERMVTMLRPSELAKIKRAAARVSLNTSDYVRQSALGQLPPSFDHLADELIASSARAHTSLDTALAKIAASEARIKKLEARP